MAFDCSLSNNSYEKYDIDANVLHQVDEALYPYNPSWNRVGVNVSGGADSAVGTATLCSLIEKLGASTEVYFLTNVRVWNNRPWAAPISIEVYNKIKSMFPNVKMERVQNYIPPQIEDGAIGIIEQIQTSGDRICTRSFNEFAGYTYKLDAVYGFITNNPTTDDFEHPRQPFDRVWTQETVDENGSCPQYKPGSTPVQVYPWKLISKEFIIGQYLRRGWEDLLNTTRSCEGDKVLFNWMDPVPFEDYTTYDHGKSKLPTCNEITNTVAEKCYWCAERLWATEQAKKLM